MEQLDFGFKACTRCKTEKHLKEFYISSAAKDGLSHYCIACKKEIYKTNYPVLFSKTNQYGKDYYKKNKNKIIKQRHLTRSKPEYQEREKLRLYFKRLLKSKTKTVFQLFGYSGMDLYDYISSSLQPEMTWINKKEWRIAFIKPLSAFDLKDPTQIRTAFAFPNIRVIWRWRGLNKSKRSVPPST